MSVSNDSKQKITAIASVVAVLLLAVIAFLLYNKVSLDKQVKEQALELEEADKLKTELEKNYYEALSDLEEMKGDNDELNALIDSQKEELKEQKDKVDRLIRSGKANKNDLDAAREEIQSLMAQRDQYLVEITSLKDENAQLADANTQLNSANQSLQTEVSTAKTNIENLTSEKAVLVSRKEELEKNNTDLSSKVTFASVVRVNNVNGVGYKIKKNGEPAKKRYAKNVNQVQICFTTTENELAGSGAEDFHVRLINPVGETQAIEEMGSGVFTNTRSGEDIRFTKIKNIDYNQQAGEHCTVWAPNTPFQKGTYEVQVYNKGYLAGEGSFALK